MGLRVALAKAKPEEVKELARHLDKFLTEITDAGDYWAEVQVEEALLKFAGKERQELGTFGDFFHEVCEDLVTRHSWDDPYGAMSPADHPELHSQFLDLIHEGYHKGSDSGYVADQINKLNGGETDED